MIHSYYFSASGTTEDIVRSIAGNIGGGDDAVVVHHNLMGMGGGRGAGRKKGVPAGGSPLFLARGYFHKPSQTNCLTNLI